MPKLFSCALLAMCIFTSLTMLPSTSAKPKTTVSTIFRIQSAELPTKPSAKDMENLLVGSHWMYFHPDKKHSLWESKTWRFGADGKLVITTNYVGRPSSSNYSWTLQRLGNHPVIRVGHRRYRLRKCKYHDGPSLCLFGPQI